MSMSTILTGAMVKIFINNKPYKEVQSISFSVDYGEMEQYGIDAGYPQEIAPTRISVKGNVIGLRVKQSGGLQAFQIRPLFQDIAASPYISIRIQDRATGEDILFVPNAKVIREGHTASTKQTYKLNFEFSGQIPLFALDRS